MLSQPLRDLWSGSQKVKRGRSALLKGFLGVGKFTIAQAIKAGLPQGSTRLVDDHILIDPAEAIIPDRDVAPKFLWQQLQRVASEALTEETVSQPYFKVIMTGCLAYNAEDTAVLVEHLRIAKDMIVPFYLVGVICECEEHGQRLGAPSRASGSKTKWQDERSRPSIHPHRYPILNINIACAVRQLV
jgi:chloramphenicol 3-O-phosphotransferase